MIEKKLRKFIVPSVFAMLGISLYVLADTFFISVAAGADGITALNMALPVYAIMYAVGSMIGIGSATRYSLDKSLGKEDYDVYFSNSFVCTLLLSLFFVAIGIFAPGNVLRLMGADDNILKTGISYMRIALLFAPAFMLNYTMTAFVRNDNNPGIAMAATLSSSIFNIIFDYIFMFPMNMGISGAALATGISPIVSMAVCLLHYCSEKNTIRLVKKLPSAQKLILACQLGISAFVGEISGGVTTLTFNFVLLKIAGNIGVAAYGVVANISIVGIAVFNGISQGLQPMASEAGGAGDEDAKKRICRHSLQIGMIISALLVFVCWIFADGIVAVFNSEGSAQMAGYAAAGLRLYSLGFLIAAANIVRAGFFGAIGSAKECFIISLMRGIVAIVFFAVVLSKFMGIYGVWLAFPAAELTTFMISMAVRRSI
ncbi:MAG: MATE family efflux transporter [Clostridium sp.]|nr:MATE family efflux transporter [Clostridium sp.]